MPVALLGHLILDVGGGLAQGRVDVMGSLLPHHLFQLQASEMAYQPKIGLFSLLKSFMPICNT